MQVVCLKHVASSREHASDIGYTFMTSWGKNSGKLVVVDITLMLTVSTNLVNLMKRIMVNLNIIAHNFISGCIVDTQAVSELKHTSLLLQK